MGFSGAKTLDYWTPQGIASGESTCPRIAGGGGGAALISGRITFCYWTAIKTELCNNIMTGSGGTAAGATPTFCGMAVYQVNSDNSLTLLAQCANDTSLWSVTFTAYVRALTSPFQKIAGARYAHATLCVTAAALPVLLGYNGNVARSVVSPVLATTMSGQSGFPASIPSGSIFSTPNFYYGEVTPLCAHAVTLKRHTSITVRVQTVVCVLKVNAGITGPYEYTVSAFRLSAPGKRHDQTRR